ncbi:unnamed protein product [Symbiodinium necroappetens]|uniref:Uncharacterized protein n=1 Tax=Symbiodinium necroappetens TaxID=1628268 RepID=A0A813BFB3_9DINO|nr:unnamed protein product [Symbiodinium necroappetens]
MNESDPDLLLKVVTKASDGSDIGTFAYRVADKPVEVAFETVEVELPAAALRSMQQDPDDPIVLSLTKFDNNSLAYKKLESLAQQSDTRLLAEPLKMAFYNAEGPITEFSADPVTITMEASGLSDIRSSTTARRLHTEVEPACAFWDDTANEWSTIGMTLAESANGIVTCAIRFDQLPTIPGTEEDVEAGVEAVPPRKPSLFNVIARAFVATFGCSAAAQIFSLEGLEALVAENRGWVIRWPAIATWITIVAAIGLLFRARRADKEYEQRLQNLLQKDTACQLLVEQAEKEFLLFTKYRQLMKLHQDLQSLGVKRVASETVHWSMVQAQLGVDYEFLHSLYMVSGQTALHREARSLLEKFHAGDVFWQLRALYTTYCRWSQVLEPALRVTCTERAAVSLCKFYSGLAVAAAFYNQGAAGLGQEGCEFLETDPVAKIVRNVVVAWVSAVVGLLPFLVLMPLFEKLRGLELQSQHIIFWTFVSVYFLCMIAVCTFQALVSYEGALDWMISALWTVTSSIVSPIAAAVGVLLVLRATNINLDEHLPFEPRDDQRYKVTLRKMAVSGSDLLKWVERDRSEIFARWEIAGHPETAAFESSNGFICLDGVTKQHAILASVFVKSQSHSVRLVGHAVLRGDSFIDHGIDELIPLYHRGQKLEDAYVHVAIEQPILSQLENLPRSGRGSIHMRTSRSKAAPPVAVMQDCDLAGITFEKDEVDFMGDESFENFPRNLDHCRISFPADDLNQLESLVRASGSKEALPAVQMQECDLAGITFEQDEIDCMDEENFQRKSGFNEAGTGPANDDEPHAAGIGDIGTDVAVVPGVADRPGQPAAANKGMYRVGDPVLLQLCGRLLAGAVVDPGSSSATVLVDEQLFPVALRQLMPAFEEFERVQVLLQGEQSQPGRILQEVTGGFRVELEVSGGVVVVQPECMQRRFEEGSTILLYRNGWVEATVVQTLVEENLLHRSEDRVQVRFMSDDCSVPSWQVKALPGVVFC